MSLSSVEVPVFPGILHARAARRPTGFEEAAISRLYGGIHYPIGIDDGVPQGRCVGQTVMDMVRTRN